MTRTKAQMFQDAHAQAKIDCRKFGGSYRVRFANALRGFHAVRAGFRGVTIVEPSRVWA
jgi:hypothetical protein